MPEDSAAPTTPDDRLAETLARKMERDDSALRSVIIDLVFDAANMAATCTQVEALVKTAIETAGDRTEQNVTSPATASDPFLRARLQGKVIRKLLTLDPGSQLIAAIRLDTEDGKIFNPDNLIKSVISIPMLRLIEAGESEMQSVLIEINVNCEFGREGARKQVANLVAQAIAQAGDPGQGQGINNWKSDTSQQYVYGKLQGKVIRRLAQLDGAGSTPVPQSPQDRQKDWRAIYHIWPDFKVRAQIWKSNATVKADACRRAFATFGRGIVWAIFDSGIDGTHPHFNKYSNLDLPSGLKHMDFTGLNLAEIPDPTQLTDDYGHGTHVAGIIAGELDSTRYKAVSLSREMDPAGVISYRRDEISTAISGVAPECKLLSFKVLDKSGEGDVSTVIAAIQKIQEINGYGRRILVHGVNMSLGYDFDPEWFACGQSPVCVEVDRLVRSGVAVVIAAGNTGKGFALTINDPGNAALAITVGATHRDMPHRYGVSYFSSKGPTGDGRRKPDVLAPGERIMSCGAGPDLQTYQRKATGQAMDASTPTGYYLERSGTSMAAPHVSGIIAGMLSVRGEYIGLPEELKKVIIDNATDLGRDTNFQGGGLVDMMRAIQSV